MFITNSATWTHISSKGERVIIV